MCSISAMCRNKLDQLVLHTQTLSVPILINLQVLHKSVVAYCECLLDSRTTAKTLSNNLDIGMPKFLARSSVDENIEA